MDNAKKLSLRELTELLIKKHEIHEGIWAITIEFKLGVMTIQDNDGVWPTAISSVSGVGIQKVDKEGPHALDAAKVNPK